jgi:hypothetical protein
MHPDVPMGGHNLRVRVLGEKRTGALFLPVDGPRIAAQQRFKSSGKCGERIHTHLNGLDAALVGVQEQVKMSRHQAVGQDIAVWKEVVPSFSQKKQVVVPSEKYIAPVDAAVVGMQKLVGLKIHFMLI